MRPPAISRWLLVACLTLSPFRASATNAAPEFFPLDPQQIEVGELLELLVWATDPEGDALALSVSGAPANAFFMDRGDGTAIFSWTPDASQTGNHVVTFHATDAGTPMASASADLAIAVGSVTNQPPVLVQPADLLLDPGVEVTVSFRATDPDGDAVTIDTQPLPPGASPTTFGFTWMPTVDQVGSYPTTVTATDSGSPPLSDSASLVITVGDVNQPPQLAPIGDRVANVGDLVRVALVASDADGDALVLSCSGLPGDAIFTDLMDGTGEIVWSPSAAGTWTATCQATDAGSPPGVAQETFDLTALATVPSAGTATLTDARWDIARARLLIRAQLPATAATSADPGHVQLEVFARLADGADVLLGARRFDRNESDVRLGLSPFIAPCQVVLATDGVQGAAMAVTGSPARCDDELLLQVHQARASCKAGLRVKGRRAPPDGTVFGNDATTGDALFAVTARRNGAFRSRSATNTPTAEMSIGVEAASHTWMLDEPVPVRGDACEGASAGGRRGGR